MSAPTEPGAPREIGASLSRSRVPVSRIVARAEMEEWKPPRFEPRMDAFASHGLPIISPFITARPLPTARAVVMGLKSAERGPMDRCVIFVWQATPKLEGDCANAAWAEAGRSSMSFAE